MTEVDMGISDDRGVGVYHMTEGRVWAYHVTGMDSGHIT